MLGLVRSGIVIDGGRVFGDVFDTCTWSIWRRCFMGNDIDYEAYYDACSVNLTEQAASLNALMQAVESVYGE